MQATTNTERIDSVTIVFAGDSGDGMQLTGTQFTNTSALAGNDLATFPDYPAEIRAPAGTRAGVSGFQLQISSLDIFTPGDDAAMLIAMNPAALVTNLHKVTTAGTVIVNTDKFKAREFEKADLETNPLEDGTLDDYFVVPVPLTSLTKEAVKPWGLKTKAADRCKNFFALGIAYWLYSRDMSHTKAWIAKKFKNKAPFDEANQACLEAGWSFAETMELLQRNYEVPAAKLPAGTYRNIVGNEATALGLVAAAVKAKLPMFLGSYPITPATDILHELAKYKQYDVTTFQAEDEIAAVCSAIGASWGGAIGLTTTSGPGLALKGEALGLAVMTELPLVIVNVQRGGPSTGLPTKTEQSDLLQAMYGRNGEAPMAVVSASTPSDCFHMAFEAVRLALHCMGPVLLLTDGYLANGSEPWSVPDPSTLPDLGNRQVTENNNPDGAFLGYVRDEATLARPWATPGTPGLEHRIGGLEKDERTGNVSYVPENHEKMCRIRAEKIARLQEIIPPLEVEGSQSGVLVLGWGSTFGAIRQATLQMRAEGHTVGHGHLNYINPFPKNLGEVLARYDKVVVPELNLGQLSKLIREKYLLEVISVPKVQGLPFKVSEIRAAISEAL
ncbi:MAG: 2-oxoacid:acceptor oxidoreductase subunit alpha [Proteobacteria bacterium]|nr:2-oxoacid:acceptor oxidoreductase subunit alpha [Pseudomonadota bacterium]MCP4916796.1 2-oxoacid:acceptor oxidoreductase subunit alpha [Pseudomonadota bacterium]